jgi:hypothetical protein
MIKLLFIFVIIIRLILVPVIGQNNNMVLTGNQSDSLKFSSIKEELKGCWKTKYSQFKYDNERNMGGEYKSRVHSSAPIFKLVIKNNEIFLEWIELTGGGSFQKVIKIKENKLILKNENGKKVIYKRNKDCK